MAKIRAMNLVMLQTRANQKVVHQERFWSKGTTLIEKEDAGRKGAREVAGN
jgi:hypothetical protein